MIPSWIIIGAVGYLVATLITRTTQPEEFRWFTRLKRPRWLSFEWAIPFIWIFIFVCVIASASLVWDAAPWTPKTWGLMVGYLMLEVAVVSYTALMCKFRSLTLGTIIGGTGFLIGLILSLFVFPVALGAGLLLLPFLLWSPIGTYVTWEMIWLNPGNA